MCCAWRTLFYVVLCCTKTQFKISLILSYPLLFRGCECLHSGCCMSSISFNVCDQSYDDSICPRHKLPTTVTKLYKSHTHMLTLWEFKWRRYCVTASRFQWGVNMWNGLVLNCHGTYHKNDEMVTKGLYDNVSRLYWLCWLCTQWDTLNDQLREPGNDIIILLSMLFTSTCI